MEHVMTTVALAMTLSGAALAQVAAPHADSRAPGNAAVKDSDVEQTTMAAQGANSFTEAQARGRIAKAGYTGVSGMRKDAAGLWQGTAKKGGKTVGVALDFKGNVVSK